MSLSDDFDIAYYQINKRTLPTHCTMGLLGEPIWTQIRTQPCKTPKKEAGAP